jgi:hypothetical protein
MWKRVIGGLSEKRQHELLSDTLVGVNSLRITRASGFDKAKVLAELNVNMFAKDAPDISPTAKFFLLRTAVGEGKFLFRHGNWSYPATSAPLVSKRMVLREDGSVGLESNVADRIATDNPWRPLKGRSVYRKPELVDILERITGAPVDRTMKTDALYARLAELVLPLSQN